MIFFNHDKPKYIINSYSIFGCVEPFIFIFYLMLSCGLLYYANAQKGSGLSVFWIVFLFVMKVAAGCISLYVHCHEYVTNDVIFYHQQSLISLKVLHSHPMTFVNDWLFNWGDFTGHYNFLSKDNMSYWTDLGVQIHLKFMIFSNLLSQGSLYTNIIFYNVIYFIGLLQLYKVFYRLQPQKKWLFVFSIFFIPSVLFWCSGIHKDGWVLAFIGLSCFYAMRYLDTKKWGYIVAIGLSLFLLFASRYFVFLCFFPPFLCWLCCSTLPKRSMLFAIFYIVLLFLFFTLGKFTPIEPMEIIVAKQHAFFSMWGYSDMQTPILENTFSSFVINLPSACDHILLRPYVSATNPLKYQMAAVDTLFVVGLIILFVLFIKRKNMQELFYVMLLFFAFSMYLFIGYTIPNCGALVRYKSEFTALLIPALVALSEVPFLKRFYVAPSSDQS